MLHTLLRLPSPGFPKDMLTGDVRVDAYLETLDQTLVGAPGVRRRTLLEAKDYLLEAMERARNDGTDEVSALRGAIGDFGQAEEIGREQRRERVAMFWRVAWPAGLMFATLNLVLSLLGLGVPTDSWQILAVVYVLQAVFFGLCMGFWAAYLVAQPMPTRQDLSGSTGFTVRYPDLVIGMGWLMVLGFGGMQVMLAASLVGLGPMHAWPPAGTLFLLLINTINILAGIGVLMFDAKVDADTLRLAGLGGRATIKRGQIVSVTAPRMPFQRIWGHYHKMHRLSWRDDAGRLHRRQLWLNRDLVHGDRLLAWIEDAASENTADSIMPCNA